MPSSRRCLPFNGAHQYLPETTVRSSAVKSRPGKVAHTAHTHRQEETTYLTDFMVLSNFPAGLLPGDSFLRRRKAKRFFISLALFGEDKKNQKISQNPGSESPIQCCKIPSIQKLSHTHTQREKMKENKVAHTS